MTGKPTNAIRCRCPRMRLIRHFCMGKFKYDITSNRMFDDMDSERPSTFEDLSFPIHKES